MNCSAMKKLLTNDFRFKPDHPEYRRVYLVNVILLLYIALSGIFAVLNAIRGTYFVAATEAAAAVLCLVTRYAFHKTNRVDVCAWALIAIMAGMAAAVFAGAGDVYYIFTWICVFPPVAFFLLGSKKGLAVSLIILAAMAAFLAFSYKSWGASEFGAVSIVNLSVTFVSLVLLIAYFEVSRQEAAAVVQQKNSELEAANRALTESREQLRLILDSAAEAVFGVDMNIRCTFCNTSCLEMLGLKSPEDLLGKDVYALIHSRRKDGEPLPRTECNIIRTCMEGIAIHADDEVFWRPSGTSLDVEYNSYPQYKDGELIGAVVTFMDNTLKKVHEQQIEYYSSHDSLTGLLNRSCFETMLRKIDGRQNLPISVIMGDLNGLKLTNDVFGHAAGDDLLVKTADILRKICRSEDRIARLGGDEFVILLPKTQLQDAQVIMSRIREVLAREQVNEIRCSMSLGCDTKSDGRQKLAQTMKNAENEMYKEKARSRNKVNADMLNAVIMALYGKSPREERHSANVSELCKAIGEALGLPDTEVAQLRSAGFMHDIGKIGIDTDAAGKHAGDDLEEEASEYRQHPVIGYRILNLFDNTLSLAESVYSHHERWDGTGFPRELKGSEIPLAARIIAVAGRYDTLLNDRGGEVPDHEAALLELQKEAGTRLDPHIVDVFVRMMGGKGQELENAAGI
ncbi:PAS domain S-box-containing protein/diguanylate cyclase (GGDEF) domain-containing protein [Sporobacter termitidis DSM 10068]|uniref:PAS domain S-box-containing protein/diguanylate cyclase (GGDEF) domain-containing protein n=1 Tax=Sporobacter termitidis DSM 10068 TaxID=1123282 RepID=A0A1M5Z8N1_9FIRM|nr:diguanylate cyclase [Sporobacter termitidis]SHI20590.1 PAS domain S-box-containing protein/diguanylate cyclase (GGDEF) domain-containing protein [Sporobacter termitidis DSM 10068]